MPLYEYKCSKCEQHFEVLQKFSDDPLTLHEGCGGAVRRLVSSPAFQFKGSGWYVTDYAKSGSKSNGTSKTPSSDSSTGDSKPAGETKPTAPAETKTT